MAELTPSSSARGSGPGGWMVPWWVPRRMFLAALVLEFLSFIFILPVLRLYEAPEYRDLGLVGLARHRLGDLIGGKPRVANEQALSAALKRLGIVPVAGASVGANVRACLKAPCDIAVVGGSPLLTVKAGQPVTALQILREQGFPVLDLVFSGRTPGYFGPLIREYAALVRPRLTVVVVADYGEKVLSQDEKIDAEGLAAYRRNPTHFENLYHREDEIAAAVDAAAREASAAPKENLPQQPGEPTYTSLGRGGLIFDVLLLRNFRTVIHKIRHPEEVAKGRAAHLTGLREPPPGCSREYFDEMTGDLLWARDEAARFGSSLAVLYTPSYGRAVGWLSDNDYCYADIIKFSAENGLATIDLAKMFAGHRDAHMLFDDTIHLTYTGEVMIADELKSRLRALMR